jgi:hypothetical protein
MKQDERRDDLAKIILGYAIEQVDRMPATDFSTRVRQLTEAVREIGTDVVERALVKLRIAVQQSQLNKQKLQKPKVLQ